MKTYKALLPLLSIAILIAFAPKDAREKEIKKAYKTLDKEFSDFVFIPGGQFMLTVDTNMSIFNKCFGYRPEPCEAVTLRSFYMSKYEVTNANWKEFVSDTKAKVKGDSFKKLLPDTNLWISNGVNYNAPMKTYYYSHPAYSNYPVVNVSIEQCMAYCKWLQEKMMQTEMSVFKNLTVRMPLDLEWQYAAKGGNDYNKYPWGGPYVRNAKGRYLANFRVVPQDEAQKVKGKIVLKMDYNSVYVTANSPKATASMITAPVNMYFENDFGLYQMAGNVAEFVIPKSECLDLEKVLETHGVTRGGSFFDPAYYMKCDSRDFYPKDSSAHFTRGFRPVLMFDRD
jgi:formylglycine-generating enzyme required for sulfatase activity